MKPTKGEIKLVHALANQEISQREAIRRLGRTPKALATIILNVYRYERVNK